MGGITRHVRGLSRITVDPQVMGGEACLRGVRRTPATVLGHLGSGPVVKHRLGKDPYRQRGDVSGAIRYDASRAAERAAATGRPPSEAAA